jgi:hypothetical protein
MRFRGPLADSYPAAGALVVFALIPYLALSAAIKLRAVAAFLAAPLLVHLAMTVSPERSAGINIAIWVCLGIAAGGGLLAFYVVTLGRARLQRPDLDRWQRGDEPAWDSPPLAAGLRGTAGRLSPRSVPHCPARVY